MRDGFMVRGYHMHICSRVRAALLSFALALLLALGVASPAFAATFPDVDYGQWYARGITYCSEHGVMGGYGSGYFGVGDPLTTEQVARILFNIACNQGETKSSDWASYNTTGLSDVRTDWYTKACNWAKANHVINGYPDGHMGIGEQVSTECFVTIPANYFSEGANEDYGANYELLGRYFTDARDVSDWAVGSAVWARQSGLMGGAVTNGGHYFLPSQSIPRERAATIIANGAKKDVIAVGMPAPSDPGSSSGSGTAAEPATPGKSSGTGSSSGQAASGNPSGATTTQPSQPSIETVYVTPHGKRFHRQDCPTIRESRTVLQLSREEAAKRGYKPCRVCKP